ncbi:MAG: HesA/MoeB/ThiF family protein [Clostridia bacterium]|nr:HesA/MoeB/ThiF family protein [Clostridia bacterium]
MNADRYARQMCLKEISQNGQSKIEDSSVLVVGVGGVNSTLLYNLAAAGVGTIGIIDPNIISVHNLNREILHHYDDIGNLKVDSAAKKLKAFNPDIVVLPISTAINKENAVEIIGQYDLVAIGVDSIQAKMIVNEACVELNTPFVDVSSSGFMGTITFIDPKTTPCLACLYGTKEPPEETYGYIGSVVSTLGSIAATSLLQYILGLEVPIAGKLLYYNALEMKFEKTDIKKNEKCPICSDKN